jgi:hypothetical protein
MTRFIVYFGGMYIYGAKELEMAFLENGMLASNLMAFHFSKCLTLFFPP